MEKKTCTKCGEEKCYVDFKPNKGYADGYHTWCRACLRLHGDEWRRNNSEYFAGYKPQALKNSAKYRENHRTVRRAESLEYYHATKDDPAKRAKRAAYRKKNREKLRTVNNLRNREIKLDVIAHYGGHCTCCGENEPDFLTLDHRNNDGKAWRKAHSTKGHGGYNLYRIVIALGYPDDLDLRCWNCNSGRRHGICPHETERLRLIAA